MIAIAQQIMDMGRVPFDIVARETGLDPLILRKLVRDGVLRGVAPYRVKGVEGWCDLDQARQIAAQLAAARAPVEGHGILATAAAEKYGFPKGTIYRWLHEGWIRVVETLPNGDRHINEGDIAFAAELVNIAGHAQGKKVFPKRQ